MKAAVIAAVVLASVGAQQYSNGFDSRGMFKDYEGCVASLETNATYCIFPTGNARFLAGQRFDLRVEVHTAAVNGTPAAPYAAAPTVQLAIHVLGNASNTLSFAPDAAVASSNAFNTYASYNFTSGTDMPARAMQRWSFGWTWRGQVAQVPGRHTVVLTVDGQVKATVHWTVHAPAAQRTAKNVILFVADGGNTAFLTATRLVSRGFKHGRPGGKLHHDTMERMGFMTTNGYDSLITDSANSAASYASGHKGPVNGLNVYGDTTPTTSDDPKVEMISEMIARKYGNANFGLGVVTTSEIQDATPAAFFAHTRRRDDKADITRQLFEGVDNGVFSAVPEIDVFLGGGGRYFIPRVSMNRTNSAGAVLFCAVPQVSSVCPEANLTTATDAPGGVVRVSNGGDSLNGRDFYAEAAAAGYRVVHNRTNMLAAASGNVKLAGIFAYSNLDTWVDRHMANPVNVKNTNAPRGYTTYNSWAARSRPLDQPDLVEMTDAAIKVLSKRGKDGFFLMVEAASVDKMEHPFDNERAMSEMIDMDNALGVALEYARAHKDTLVLVTSDHGHGFDAFGVVDTAVFDALDATTTNPADKVALRQSAIGFYNKAGSPTYVDTDGDGHVDNFASARYTLATGYVDIPHMKEQYRLHDAPRVPGLTREQAFGADDNVVGGNRHGLSMARNMPSSSGVHTMQDVYLLAEGPGAHMVKAQQENVELFDIMAAALSLGA